MMPAITHSAYALTDSGPSRQAAWPGLGIDASGIFWTLHGLSAGQLKKRHVVKVAKKRGIAGNAQEDDAVLRTPAASSAVRSRTPGIPAAPPSASRRRRTKAEPTITPSAKVATCAAWAPLLTPRPTATGRPVCSRIRLTRPAASLLTASLVPVMPISEAA